MSYRPPDGWMIKSDIVFDGINDFEVVWYVHQWKRWIEKKWLRKPVKREGWQVVYTSRHQSGAEAWLQATLKAIEAERKE